MKPQLHLLAIHSREFFSSFWHDLEGRTNIRQETEMFSFQIALISPEHALREIAKTAHQLDGILLYCDLQHPISWSLGLALSFAQALSVPILSVVMISPRGVWLETFENQLREYFAQLELNADEIPILSVDSFSFSAPPAQWISLLEENQSAFFRWSKRLEPQRPQEARQAVAYLCAVPNHGKPLFSPVQKERLVNVQPITPHQTVGKAKLCLIPPVQTMLPGTHAKALLTFAKTSKENGLTLRSFLKGALGTAPTWKEGECFMWDCDSMEGVGTITRIVTE